jgi:hypothetical protein
LPANMVSPSKKKSSSKFQAPTSTNKSSRDTLNYVLNHDESGM